MSETTSTNPGQVREIPTHEALALLRESPVGRLAIVVGDEPDIFPVNHLVDRGTIVFRTARGTKLLGSAGLPVAFEVDGYDTSTGEAWSVVVHGVGEVVFRTDEVLDALQLPLMPWQGGSKPEIVRIVPDRVTGRRFPVLGGVRTAV